MIPKLIFCLYFHFLCTCPKMWDSDRVCKRPYSIAPYLQTGCHINSAILFAGEGTFFRQYHCAGMPEEDRKRKLSLGRRIRPPVCRRILSSVRRRILSSIRRRFKSSACRRWSRAVPAYYESPFRSGQFFLVKQEIVWNISKFQSTKQCCWSVTFWYYGSAEPYGTTDWRIRIRIRILLFRQWLKKCQQKIIFFLFFLLITFQRTFTSVFKDKK